MSQPVTVKQLSECECGLIALEMRFTPMARTGVIVEVVGMGPPLVQGFFLRSGANAARKKKAGSCDWTALPEIGKPRKVCPLCLVI